MIAMYGSTKFPPCYLAAFEFLIGGVAAQFLQKNTHKPIHLSIISFFSLSFSRILHSSNRKTDDVGGKKKIKNDRYLGYIGQQ